MRYRLISKSSPTNLVISLAVAALSLLAVAVSSQAQTQNFCSTTNGIKFLMPPNVNGGLDVLDTHRIVLADDFLCTNSGFITDIHLWGSWSNDLVGTISTFYLYIYSDVPAGPANNFSQPGTLLWQESFAPGQYSSNIFATGTESFYDPSNNILSGDQTAWQFCFTPTNPFYQTGSLAAPTNYWLMAYASGVTSSNAYGWKTSTLQYNDAAMWASWNDVTLLPTGNWTPMVNPASGSQIDLSFELYTSTNVNGCSNACIQFQNLTNIVVNSCTGCVPVSYPVTASDNCCPAAGATLTFTPTNGYCFPPGTTTVTCTATDACGNCNSTNFTVTVQCPANTCTNSCIQFQNASNLVVNSCTGCVPVSYSVTAADNCCPGTAGATLTFTPTNGYCFPPGTTTVTCTATDACGYCNSTNFTVTVQCVTNTVQCVETNGVKYLQGPNLDGGLDVWNNGPWVLADDFVCTNAGPIRDIHIWGSWNDDAPAPGNLTFTLAVYSDVPVNSTNTFSHPGTKLWSQVFLPGQYAENQVLTGQESFFNPGGSQILGPDTQVWYYCFYPTNLNQTGSLQSQSIYWLMAYAQLPAGLTNMYGWKTTTNVHNDTSVFAPWPGSPPPTGWGWIPNKTASGSPFDLAFKLTTPTNPCEISVECPLDKSVQCGSAWSFDKPTVLGDPCCPTLPAPILTSVVSSGTCPEVITGTWTITDCVGTTAYCSQNVTLTNSPPPIITCPSNIITETCSSNAQVFWSATVTDCSGFTNGISVSSSPASGTFFNVDTTNTVNVTATDPCGNSNTCSFTVAVIRPPSLGYLTIATNGITNVVVTWTNIGILQFATNLTGSGTNTTWTDLPSATSPFTTNTGPPKVFFRLRCGNP